MESQIENSQMRSIAVLGMVYLPLSCVGVCVKALRSP